MQTIAEYADIHAPILFSLDMSTTVAGWCLAQGERYINSGEHRAKGRDVGERLKDLCDLLRASLALHDPDIVAFEEPTAFRGNPVAHLRLGEAMGVARMVSMGFDIHFLPINTMKVKATGYHKGTRFEAAALVEKESVTSDEADAIGVWQAALKILREEALLEQA